MAKKGAAARPERPSKSASGFQVRTFAAPSELLTSEIPRSNACMVVDIDMPEMNGIEMCEVLKGSGQSVCISALIHAAASSSRTRPGNWNACGSEAAKPAFTAMKFLDRSAQLVAIKIGPHRVCKDQLRICAFP